MHLIESVVGPDQSNLTWWQETDRAVIIFVIGLAMFRLSGLRTFSRFSPLDTVVTIIIGSNLSRALTGGVAFVPTLVASLAFVLLHRLLAQLAVKSRLLSWLLKGRPKALIVDGVLQPKVMRQEAITSHDLEEAARLRGLAGLQNVKSASLERNGSISLHT